MGSNRKKGEESNCVTRWFHLTRRRRKQKEEVDKSLEDSGTTINGLPSFEHPIALAENLSSEKNAEVLLKNSYHQRTDDDNSLGSCEHEMHQPGENSIPEQGVPRSISICTPSSLLPEVSSGSSMSDLHGHGNHRHSAGVLNSSRHLARDSYHAHSAVVPTSSHHKARCRLQGNTQWASASDGVVCTIHENQNWNEDVNASFRLAEIEQENELLQLALQQSMNDSFACSYFEEMNKSINSHDVATQDDGKPSMSLSATNSVSCLRQAASSAHPDCRRHNLCIPSQHTISTTASPAYSGHDSFAWDEHPNNATLHAENGYKKEVTELSKQRNVPDSQSLVYQVEESDERVQMIRPSIPSHHPRVPVKSRDRVAPHFSSFSSLQRGNIAEVSPSRNICPSSIAEQNTRFMAVVPVETEQQRLERLEMEMLQMALNRSISEW